MSAVLVGLFLFFSWALDISLSEEGGLVTHVRAGLWEGMPGVWPADVFPRLAHARMARKRAHTPNLWKIADRSGVVSCCEGAEATKRTLSRPSHARGTLRDDRRVHSFATSFSSLKKQLHPPTFLGGLSGEGLLRCSLPFGTVCSPEGEGAFFGGVGQSFGGVGRPGLFEESGGVGLAWWDDAPSDEVGRPIKEGGMGREAEFERSVSFQRFRQRHPSCVQGMAPCPGTDMPYLVAQSVTLPEIT